MTTYPQHSQATSYGVSRRSVLVVLPARHQPMDAERTERAMAVVKAVLIPMARLELTKVGRLDSRASMEASSSSIGQWTQEEFPNAS